MFDLNDKVVAITGGAGMLGRKHAEAVAEQGAVPVLLDIDGERALRVSREVGAEYGVDSLGLEVDITNEEQVSFSLQKVIDDFGRVDALINNAANNPKVDESGGIEKSSRLEEFSVKLWESDIAVGLTGAFLCSKHFGNAIAQNENGGSIINVSSDLGVIAPDQRLYRQEGLSEDKQPVKPVTYSVIKAGLLGLTRYLATYWPQRNVRSNALCPGGIHTDQDSRFVEALVERIPLGRMATQNDYKGVIVFLVSDESCYMNGAIVCMDGGRSTW